MFLSMSGEFNKEKERLAQKHTNLTEKLQEEQNTENSIDYMSIIKQISNFDIVEKSILFKLIERIEITADRQILISWKFTNPYI